MQEETVLVIGDKAWSSWSLRPWLAAKVAKVPFREVQVRLRQPDTAEQIARHSPSARVPVLRRGSLLIWDSLAICEYLAEIAPQASLWPEDANARAVARSVSAEMHSGFHALRKECPMDFHARIEGHIPSDQARTDISRITALWRESPPCVSGRTDLSCSALSRLPMPCMHRSRRVSEPMASTSPGSVTMAQPPTMQARLSPCPRCRNGDRAQPAVRWRNCSRVYPWK